MSAWTMEFEFGWDNEHPLTFCGAVLAEIAVGVAELEEDLDAEKGWLVSAITFGRLGSKRISINDRSGNWIATALFKELAARIEADPSADLAWEKTRYAGHDAQALRARTAA